MGVPVLAADNRGTREFMVDEENGYVCKQNNPCDYAGLIKKMYEEQEYWSTNIEKRVEIRNSTENFDKKNTIKIMREVYGTAIN